MNDEDRGKIHHREQATRIKDYSGLRYGKITPTDIDGFLDFNDKIFVFIELKKGDSLPPYGQRLALERLCDACEKAGKSSLVLIASHDAAGDIDAANLPVVQIRLHGKWRKPIRPMTVRRAIDDFLTWANREKESKEIA
jgi:glycerophosphoryl diester phosphodiesterase